MAVDIESRRVRAEPARLGLRSEAPSRAHPSWICHLLRDCYRADLCATSTVSLPADANENFLFLRWSSTRDQGLVLCLVIGLVMPSAVSIG